MAKVIGIGGIFFKSDDPKRLSDWYAHHLGIGSDASEGVTFPWRRADDPSREEMTVWSIFKSSSDYFGSPGASFMINLIVDDLDGMLASLVSTGASIVERREDYNYGRFGWVTDPDGNRIELWEPPAPTNRADG